MSADTAFDFADTLRAKSNQLNADDLVGGPITVQIVGASQGETDQPLVLRLSGGHQPWKPCKTMRRLLAAAVGSTKTVDIVGRWVTLFRDPTVRWAGKEEGGIRMAAISGIDRPITAALQVTRGKRQPFTVEPLREPRQAGAPTADLDRVLSDAGLTLADVDAYRAKSDPPKCPVAECTADQRAAMAVWLANPANAAKVRPASSTPETP